MADCNVLFLVGSTNEFYHTVTKESDGSPIDDAIIVGAITELDDTPVGSPGTTTNLGDGKYSVVFPTTTTTLLVSGTEYYYNATITAGLNTKLIRLSGFAEYARE
jgi:hypothetical protein